MTRSRILPLIVALAACVLAPAAAALAVPATTSEPSIKGTPRAGQTLTCDPGAWSGVGAIRFEYEWLRDANDVVGTAVPTVESSR